MNAERVRESRTQQHTAEGRGQQGQHRRGTAHSREGQQREREPTSETLLPPETKGVIRGHA